MTTIGILGARGALGAASVRALRALGLDDLRLSVRNRSGVEDSWARPVDASDANAVRALSRGCAVVVNCAGPMRVAGHRLAEVVLSAGADFVDVCDPDEHEPPSYELSHGRTVVVGAGQMPGLATVLASLLVRGGCPMRHLTVRVGGPYAFTYGAAYDFVERMCHPRGQTMAAVRDGRACTGVLRPQRGVTLPFFVDRVDVVPYLLDEAAALARRRHIAALDWYTVFAGTETRRWLGAHRGGKADDVTLDEMARGLVRASHADTAAGTAYQTLTYEGTDAHGTRSLIVTSADPPALSGVAVALAVQGILSGRILPGRRRVAECIEPEDAWDCLARQPSTVTSLRFDGPLSCPAWEEGRL